MFQPSTLFRLFDSFRAQSGKQSTAPRVSVDQATGMMTVVCRTMPGPRVSVDQGTGLVTILSCLDLATPVDPGGIPATALITADGIPLVTADGNYLTTVS